MIVDVEQVVRALNISPEKFAQWKAANLDDHPASGSVTWTMLEDSGFRSTPFHPSADLRIG